MSGRARFLRRVRRGMWLDFGPPASRMGRVRPLSVRYVHRKRGAQ